MNTRIITVLSIMLLAACSCTNDIHEQGAAWSEKTVTLMVNMEDAGTKAFIDGAKTLLHSEDLFSVFYQGTLNEQWVYTGDDGSTSGNLTACTDIDRIAGTDKIYAVYPWSETASISNGTVSTVLPQEQYFTEGTYGRGAAVLAAQASSVYSVLNFRYASGFVRLRLSGNAMIKDIKLSSTDDEALAGACTISMSSGVPVLTATGSSSVLLRNLDFAPIVLDGTKDFIFSVAPGTYQEGVTFDITYTAGQVQTVRKSGPFTVAAGVLATPVEAVAQPLLTLEANFYLGGEIIASPFDVTLTRDIVPGSTGSTSESKDIYLKTDTEKKYPFRFYISNKDKTDNLRVTRSGLNFGGTTGDYILLPGIEGMRLVSVFLSASNCTVRINSEDSVNPTALINISEATAGKACKLELCSDTIVRINNIILYYDTAL